MHDHHASAADLADYEAREIVLPIGWKGVTIGGKCLGRSWKTVNSHAEEEYTKEVLAIDCKDLANCGFA
jgi:hypothetical protein